MVITINWYEQELVKKWGQIVPSEAHKELMRREFEMLQIQKRNFERTNSWMVPLKLEFDINGIQGHWRVVVADENTVLYLD